jgi:Fe-S-cluster containining protein
VPSCNQRDRRSAPHSDRKCWRPGKDLRYDGLERCADIESIRLERLLAPPRNDESAHPMTDSSEIAGSNRAYPFRFRCRRSGNCCARPEGVVRVSPLDITPIADHLRTSETAVRARFVAASGDRLIDGPGGRCPFLEDGQETRCGIYAVRPKKCRSWPYWDEFLDNPAALREAARLCPGIELSNLPLHSGFDSADD